MINKRKGNAGGFTLVEIMIVVAIIALLAAIAVPNFLRARKRSQATRILEDLRLIDAAVDQYAIEHNKSTNDLAVWVDVQPYLKAGSQLYNSGGKDLFGAVYGTYGHGDDIFVVDGNPNVNLDPLTFSKLSDVAPSDFWSPYNNIPQ